VPQSGLWQVWIAIPEKTRPNQEPTPRALLVGEMIEIEIDGVTESLTMIVIVVTKEPDHAPHHERGNQAGTEKGIIIGAKLLEGSSYRSNIPTNKKCV